MAPKMKVEELRTELAQRGLSTTGLKPTLGERELGNEDLDNSDKLFRGMGVQQPREEASRRGISVVGSKKQLLDRPCQELRKGRENTHEDEATNCEEKEKIVTATKKGAAVLDQWLSDHVKTQYHVLQMAGEIYDAMLNQTNVGENINKFYEIQVLG